MRRYVFYLAIALLAFTMSVLTYNLLTLLKISELKSESLKIIKESESLPDQHQSVEPPISKKQNFSCTDEAAKIVWEKMKTDKTDKDMMDWTKWVIEDSSATDCEQIFDKQIVDLADNKSVEVIFRGRGTLCSSGADCHTWILSKIKNKYRIVLELYASEISGDFQVLHKTTGKYNDIRVKKNNHRLSDTYGYFKFDGEKYRIKKCFEDVNSNELVNHNYQDDLKNGNKKLIAVNPKNCL